MILEQDLRQIASILLKKLWVLILAMILFGAAAYSVSRWLLPKKYSSSVSMYVYNQGNRTGSNITSVDLQTSQKLVSTYIVVLRSNNVLDKVSEELEGEYSAAEIRKMLTTGAINNTEAFDITITNPDPETAQTIVNTIAKVLPDEIKRVVKAGSVEVIDYARLPNNAAWPNVERITLIAMLLGLVLAAAAILLVELSDSSIRSEEDLKKVFELPVLGVIPRLYAEKGGQKNGHEN